MSTDALKEKLNELHTALAGTDKPDAELLALVRSLEADVHALLEREQATQDAGLAARAQSISARFAAKHPRLTPALNELTDMLASMGI